jgi:hypothetical protein
MLAIPVIVAITFHEAAHGYVALHFGDSTAKDEGRVTLNPSSTSTLGNDYCSRLFCISTAGFLFGYAKPVPVKFGHSQSRWHMIWVAIAGPAMNILLAIVFSDPFGHAHRRTCRSISGCAGAQAVGGSQRHPRRVQHVAAAALDGSKVVAPFLPIALARRISPWRASAWSSCCLCSSSCQSLRSAAASISTLWDHWCSILQTGLPARSCPRGCLEQRRGDHGETQRSETLLCTRFPMFFRI